MTDAASHTIRRVTPDGSVTTVAGKAYMTGAVDGHASEARFTAPTGAACDAAGNVYVTMFHCIRKIAADGAVSTLAGSAVEGNVDGAGTVARFSNPLGLACDNAGNVFVADNGNQAVRKIAPDGTVSTLARGKFSSPASLAWSPFGSLFVGDTDLLELTPDGVVTARRTGGAGFVACNSAGDVFFVQDNTVIKRITRIRGVEEVVAGRSGVRGVQPGRLPGTLNYVSGLALLPEGNLAVLSENSVLVIQLD